MFKKISNDVTSKKLMDLYDISDQFFFLITVNVFFFLDSVLLHVKKADPSVRTAAFGETS